MRQNAHAYIWLLGLFLALAGAAFVAGRRGRRLAAATLGFFSAGTAILGIVVAYGCFYAAPSQMGYVAPDIDLKHIELYKCLGQGAMSTAVMWTIVALSCSGALGLVAFSRSRGSWGLRVLLYAAAALLLLVAGAEVFFADFAFSWCTSSRLF